MLIVVSDLEKHRPIWFGGTDRSEGSLDEFYRDLGEKKARKIRLVVMGMPTATTVMPSLYPSFLNNGVPEYPVEVAMYVVIQHLRQC